MLGPEDLTHKEFELRYKQFVNVNDGIINKNVKTMPKNRQESFKMQKEHYDFIENKIVEKEELREAEHMDLMNRRTKKLQNRNKSQSKPKELIVEKQKTSNENAEDVKNKQALLLIKREHDLKFLKTMSKAQTEFMKKHKQTAQIISKVIDNKANLKDVKDSLMKCIEDPKANKTKCECPDIKITEEDRIKIYWNKTANRPRRIKSDLQSPSRNFTHRDMITRTNQLINKMSFNNFEDRMSFVKSLQNEQDIQKIFEMLNLTKSKQMPMTPRIQEPKITILSNEVKQLEASQANISQRSGMKYASSQSIISEAKGFNKNRKFGFKSPQAKTTTQKLEVTENINSD